MSEQATRRTTPGAKRCETPGCETPGCETPGCERLALVDEFTLPSGVSIQQPRNGLCADCEQAHKQLLGLIVANYQRQLLEMFRVPSELLQDPPDINRAHTTWEG